MSKTDQKYRFSSAVFTVIIVEVLFWGLFAIGYYGVMKTIAGARFEHPMVLWFLIALPLISVLFIISISRRNKALHRFIHPELLRYLIPDISTFRHGVKYVLYRFGMGLLLVALSNPQVGSKLAKAKTNGAEIMIALDVSNSMLAQDIKPNRLERAKRAIEQLIDKLGGDRIGLAVFAGQAYIQLPLTDDYHAAKMFLRTINTSSVAVQGTRIGDVLRVCKSGFDDKSSASKVIILITDGETHDEDAQKDAKKLGDKDIYIYTIGMGSSDGAPIPKYSNGRQDGYMTDKNGNTVISKLNGLLLRQIAVAGNGSFTRASSAQVGLTSILADVNKLRHGATGSISYTEYEDRFLPFLIAGSILLLLEALTGTRKPKWLNKWKFLEK